MAKETRVKVKVLTSFASPSVNGTMQGYRPQTEVELPRSVALGWVGAGLVEMVDEPGPEPEQPRRGRAQAVEVDKSE